MLIPPNPHLLFVLRNDRTRKLSTRRVTEERSGRRRDTSGVDRPAGPGAGLPPLGGDR